MTLLMILFICLYNES